MDKPVMLISEEEPDIISSIETPGNLKVSHNIVNNDVIEVSDNEDEKS